MKAAKRVGLEGLGLRVAAKRVGLEGLGLRVAAKIPLLSLSLGALKELGGFGANKFSLTVSAPEAVQNRAGRAFCLLPRARSARPPSMVELDRETHTGSKRIMI
jgi:hypothetical protein